MPRQVAHRCLVQVRKRLNVASTVAILREVSQRDLALISSTYYEPVVDVGEVVEDHCSKSCFQIPDGYLRFLFPLGYRIQCGLSQWSHVQDFEYDSELCGDLFRVFNIFLVPGLSFGEAESENFSAT